ncbi:MAG: hypothetical protein JXR25_15165 [Pontiellaceae bacterium]|nr:hypothetical protein [Pontiellaceae bacterium]MBN2786160.1 hypothetical protein [Pontiellaceae bacterium]
MEKDNVQIFYDGNGNAIAVQMPIADYEKIIKSAKEAVEAKEAIVQAIETLQGAI